MAYVSVPKDLTQVKPKFLFNLTKRQVICFGGGAALGLPLFFLTKNVIGIAPDDARHAAVLHVRRLREKRRSP